jgi:hypothetical protein
MLQRTAIIVGSGRWALQGGGHICIWALFPCTNVAHIVIYDHGPARFRPADSGAAHP